MRNSIAAIAGAPGSGRGIIPLARGLLSVPAMQATLVLCGACLVSWLSRQDKNWDLQNYHLHAAWALLEGRLDRDLFPTGIQSYLNPLLDVPYFLATQWLADRPRLVAVLAGLPFGALVLASVGILRVVGRCCGAGPVAVAVAVAIGLSGSTIVAEIGTSFGDIPVAVLMLAALLALLHGAGRARWGWHALLAGALGGTASGLKLTQIVFAAALPIVLVAAGGGARRIGRGLLLLGLGGLAAFVLVEGWWAVRVAARFGNPAFPYLNDLFRSEWGPPLSYQDTTYLPGSAWRAAVLPFLLLGKRAFVVSETAFRDPRLALAWLGVVASGAAWLAASRRPTAATAPALRMVLAFLAATYALWVWKFGIVRYAVGLEALAGLPVLLALRLGLPGLRDRHLVACLFGVLVAAMAATNYTGWGRTKAYGDTVFDVPPIVVPDNTVVVLAGKPLGFLAPFVQGHAVAFLGLAEAERGTRLGAELAARITMAPRLAVIVNRPPETLAGWLGGFGLAIREASCRPIRTQYQAGIAICDAVAIR